jgi:hypothetical protein
VYVPPSLEVVESVAWEESKVKATLDWSWRGWKDCDWTELQQRLLRVFCVSHQGGRIF